MAMAVALLLQNVGVSFFSPTRAALEHPQADLSVVGQPSLPAATVDAIFKSHSTSPPSSQHASFTRNACNSFLCSSLTRYRYELPRTPPNPGTFRSCTWDAGYQHRRLTPDRLIASLWRNATTI